MTQGVSKYVQREANLLRGKKKRSTFWTTVMLPWHHMGTGWFGNVSYKLAWPLLKADTLNIEPAGYPQTQVIKPRSAPKL